MLQFSKFQIAGVLGLVLLAALFAVPNLLSEETRESYDPDGNVLRSEQTSQDLRRGEGETGGVPGAVSNQPGAAPPEEDDTAAPVKETRSATRNTYSRWRW